MNTKPSLKSYYKKQINIYFSPFIEDKETGIMYEEVNGKLHNIIISIITGVVLLTVVYLDTSVIYSIRNTFLIILCLVAPFIITFICILVLKRVFYKISKFKVISENDLYKYE